MTTSKTLLIFLNDLVKLYKSFAVCLYYKYFSLATFYNYVDIFYFLSRSHISVLSKCVNVNKMESAEQCVS